MIGALGQPPIYDAAGVHSPPTVSSRCASSWGWRWAACCRRSSMHRATMCRTGSARQRLPRPSMSVVAGPVLGGFVGGHIGMQAVFLGTLVHAAPAPTVELAYPLGTDLPD